MATSANENSWASMDSFLGNSFPPINLMHSLPINLTFFSPINQQSIRYFHNNWSRACGEFCKWKQLSSDGFLFWEFFPAVDKTFFSQSVQQSIRHFHRHQRPHMEPEVAHDTQMKEPAGTGRRQNREDYWQFWVHDATCIPSGLFFGIQLPGLVSTFLTMKGSWP